MNQIAKLSLGVISGQFAEEISVESIFDQNLKDLRGEVLVNSLLAFHCLVFGLEGGAVSIGFFILPVSEEFESRRDESWNEVFSV